MVEWTGGERVQRKRNGHGVRFLTYNLSIRLQYCDDDVDKGDDDIRTMMIMI